MGWRRAAAADPLDADTHVLPPSAEPRGGGAASGHLSDDVHEQEERRADAAEDEELEEEDGVCHVLTIVRNGGFTLPREVVHGSTSPTGSTCLKESARCADTYV
jgi:hypothetical protein